MEIQKKAFSQNQEFLPNGRLFLWDFHPFGYKNVLFGYKNVLLGSLPPLFAVPRA